MGKTAERVFLFSLFFLSCKDKTGNKMSKENKKQIKEALNLIDEWNKHLDKNIREEKFKKMAQSPYYFYRGTNFLFWNYFAKHESLKFFGNENTQTWIQADLHAYNYGIYDKEDGELVYGLNDFDESCIGDYRFDLWRMAASMVLIAQENGFSDKETIRTFIDAFNNGYLSVIDNYRLNGTEILYYINKENAFGKLDEVMEQTEKKESRKEMLKKWTNHKNGKMLFDVSYRKLAEISSEKKAEVVAAMKDYLATINKRLFAPNYFKVIDVAKRISSGTGSYGTPRYYILIEGSGKEYEQRILDAKFQFKPCAYKFLDDQYRTEYDKRFRNEGQRHKEAYLALSAKNDPHLGWITLSEGVFSVRERSPYKSYFPTELLNTEKRFKKLAMQWGSILANAHIKANPEFALDDVLKISSKMKTDFSERVYTTAIEFAEYNNLIYKNFLNKFFLDE